MKRYQSIDIMRTIAIVFMVLCHFTIYLAPGYESEHSIDREVFIKVQSQ